MKHIQDSSGSGLEEGAVSILLTCIVFLGIVFLFCANVADAIRSGARRAACRADARRMAVVPVTAAASGATASRK
jgi:hypothetical protein